MCLRGLMVWSQHVMNRDEWQARMVWAHPIPHPTPPHQIASHPILGHRLDGSVAEHGAEHEEDEAAPPPPRVPYLGSVPGKASPARVGETL